jgi:hypothetical protein
VSVLRLPARRPKSARKHRLDIAVKAEHVIAPTQEIPAEQVLALWEARDTGRLGPVTNPGRIGTY